MLEDLHKGLRSILLSSSLDLLGQSGHSSITILGRLELDDLVRVAPFLDLEDLGLVLLVKELSALVLGANVHNEETNDVGSRSLGSGGRNGLRDVGGAVSCSRDGSLVSFLARRGRGGTARARGWLGGGGLRGTRQGRRYGRFSRLHCRWLSARRRRDAGLSRGRGGRRNSGGRSWCCRGGDTGLLLGSSVGEVETLGAHLCTNSAILDLQDEIAEGRISKVEVPHVLECTLVDLAESCLTSDRAAEGVAACSSRGHLLDKLEGILKEVLLGLILLNGGLNLTLDRLPDVVEGGLGGGKLASVVVESRVDAELVVGATVSEVKTGRDREVGLERHRELVEDTLSRRRGVCDKDTGLSRIVDSVSSINELSHLQKSRPHGSLSTSNGSAALTVVEELVHDNSTTKAE